MSNLSPLAMSIIASFVAFAFTTLGGVVVFFFNKLNKNIVKFIVSFSAGIMIASSFFSLILVAIEKCNSKSQSPATICTLGILFGIFFILVTEYFVEKTVSKNELRVISKQSILSMIAITLHNIPEGLCMGVVFAGAGMVGTEEMMISAILLSMGISIQNFPEGTSVALSMYKSGVSKRKSFFLAMISGIVEPIASIVGFLFTSTIDVMLPFLLTFAAGTMISVACTDMIPESVEGGNKIATVGLCFGFCLMMFLDLMF